MQKPLSPASNGLTAKVKLGQPAIGIEQSGLQGYLVLKVVGVFEGFLGSAG